MRIVSLLPSATEIVSLLGLQDQLVGVSADSDWPVDVVQKLPVVNTMSINTGQLTSREIDAAVRAATRAARRAAPASIAVARFRRADSTAFGRVDFCRITRIQYD